VQISLWIEALITLSVVVAFSVVGVWALRVIHQTEHLLLLFERRVQEENSHIKRIADLAIDKGKRMRLRVLVILHLMLSAYIFRAIFECMHAYSYSGVDRSNKNCGVCGDCQNIATLMSAWFETNPQVQIMSNMIAGPVALVLSLYGMKAGSILRLTATPHDHSHAHPSPSALSLN
jgi:hypothetical protein